MATKTNTVKQSIGKALGKGLALPSPAGKRNNHLPAAQPTFGDSHSTQEHTTRRLYDVVSGVYFASTFLFHSRAHREAIEMSGIRDGTRLLEVATGSGEMFRRLVQANSNGQSVGLDLSPKMAARTLRSVRRTFPNASACCSAVDARQIPFPDGAFDLVMCCYLLELLSAEDIVQTLLEIRRVLRRGGGLTVLLVGQNTPTFNGVYEVFGKIAPAFWGRQVSEGVPDILQRVHFRIAGDRTVHQIGYPSRILTASRIEAPTGTSPSL